MCFPGIPTHILLNTTGLSPPARADRLELLSITGEVIKTLPIRYYPERKPYGLWNITEFIPPNEAFFLRVTGYDLDGFLFQRVSSVSFSSIIPGQWCRLSQIFRWWSEGLMSNLIICWVINFVFFDFIHLTFRCPKGADGSHNSWLLPPERGCQMPGRQPDTLHSALQQGWETTWGGSTLQVSRDCLKIESVLFN